VRRARLAISHGTYCEDLYYRLAVFDIALRPLRERTNDIPALAAAFLESIGRSVGRPAAGFADEALERLVGYRWPGDVSELRNAIERAVILCDGGMIRIEHLPLGVAMRRPG
jgi:DNA-binding NtrC family response regulator